MNRSRSRSDIEEDRGEGGGGRGGPPRRDQWNHRHNSDCPAHQAARERAERNHARVQRSHRAYPTPPTAEEELEEGGATSWFRNDVDQRRQRPRSFRRPDLGM